MEEDGIEDAVLDQKRSPRYTFGGRGRMVSTAARPMPTSRGRKNMAAPPARASPVAVRRTSPTGMAATAVWRRAKVFMMALMLDCQNYSAMQHINLILFTDDDYPFHE